MAMAVNGRISYYERDGKLQFYVDAVKQLEKANSFAVLSNSSNVWLLKDS